MKPRLLFVSHFLPHPVYSGAASRTLNLILELARGFHVRVVPFVRRPQHGSMADAETAVRALRARGLDVAPATRVPSDWSRLRRLAVHPTSALLQRPFGTVRLESSDFRERVQEELRQRPALIHLDTLDLVGHANGVHGVPVVCNYHDVESPTLQRRAENAGGMLMRTYLRHQAARYEALERARAPGFALNVVCSGKEREHLVRIAPGARVEVIPNGVDTDYFSPSAEAPSARNIVFVGGLDMEPNFDGIRFFLDEVWPHLLARVPDCTLSIIGQAPERRVAELRHHPNTTFEGRVEDVRPWMARAGCVIVPLRLGGATRLKIVHAWGMAKAVVATSVGCEGLDARDGDNIIVRDEPAAFAEGIESMLEDAARRTAIGEAGRVTAVETYSWTVIGARARSLYAGLL